MTELELTRTQYLELEKLGQGACQPVNGFMTKDEFHSVCNSMRLPDGQVFPLPIYAISTDHIVKCPKELWERGDLIDEDMVLVTSVGYPNSGNRMNLIETHLVSDLRGAMEWDD